MDINVLKENIALTSNDYQWLVRPNNLTETIKLTGAKFSLNVLSQLLDEPYFDEVNAFEKYHVNATYSFIRKVFLEANNCPIIFARVIVPETTYLNYLSIFNTLGKSSIGNTFLYADKNVIRQAFEYKQINRDDELFVEIKKLNPIPCDRNDYWARRSIFALPKGHLLISEIFLNMPDYPETESIKSKI